MISRTHSAIAGIGLALLLVGFTVFPVHETERAMVLRLGQLKSDAEGLPKIYEPGLNFKVPLLDTVRYFDTRIQTILISTSRIVTNEKKDVIVDLFVKWKIQDCAKFFTATGGRRDHAEKLLRQQIVNDVRAEFGRRTIKEVVSGERSDLMQSILKEVASSARHLGIQVIDTRVKRIDLPEEVSESVYERMRSERQRIADEHRAQGQAKANVVRAKADARVTVILANAEESAKHVRGEGDAEASRIYAESHGKDKDFFEFYRSMQAYRETFKNKNDILLVKPDGDFFRFFGK